MAQRYHSHGRARLANAAIKPSPLEEFETEAPRHPVFHLIGQDGSAT